MNRVQEEAIALRKQLVNAALRWEEYFGVGPNITSTISELDAALLVGVDLEEFCKAGQVRTAVTKDVDFTNDGVRYQVTANRPSGKPGSFVTLISQKTERKRPFGWDRLIWILYDRYYEIQEAWELTAEDYRTRFEDRNRLSPDDMRKGRALFFERKKPH